VQNAQQAQARDAGADAAIQRDAANLISARKQVSLLKAELALANASLISRLSHAVDLIEERSQQNRPWKVVTVRRGLNEDPDAARDRHFAAHPEDRGANIVIFHFFDDGGAANKDDEPPDAAA
jgi:hypothetical protein